METGQMKAIVTGAGAGIGRATALRLAADGFETIAVDMRATAAQETAALIGSQGGRGSAHTLDLRDAAAVVAFARQVGSADVLINNAGIFDVRPFAELTGDDFRRMAEVNVIPIFELSRAFAELAQEGARIVNVASRAHLGALHYAHYVASKAAVVGLTRAMALELAPRRILVNAVAPGVIDTDMVKSRSDTDRGALAAQQPLGRLGQPEDVADAIAYLASPRLAFVTGQVLLIDGGRSLGGMTA
jgi:3-oxoacyl-[acyl-carrier protein] reductase